MPTPEEIEAIKAAQAQASHSVFDAPTNAPSVVIPTERVIEKTAEEIEAEKSTSLFSEDLFKENEKDEQQKGPDAELIAKLEAQGFKVEKKEVVDKEAEITKKIEFHEKNINDAKEFIAKDDKYIVLEKLKNDKADMYSNTGRQHLINSEEFNIEIEAELEANYENPAILKMFADNLRSAIKQNVIDKNDNEKQKIVSEIQIEKAKDIQERTKKLDGSFDTIYKDGYLGLKFEKQEVIDARNNVVNGKFTEEIKNNPEILAKLALVYYQEQKLIQKVGQPTYGEGIAATYHTLNGGDKSNFKASPAAVSQNASSASDGTFQVNKWLNVVDQEEDSNKKVI